MTEYAELHCHSFFSLLDAASSPEALVARAKELELPALTLTDHDSLAGAVRFWTAARRAGIHPVIGAEVTLADESEGAERHLTLLAESQQGFANLCRLLTAAYLRDTPADLSCWPGKGRPLTTWEALAGHCQGLLALSGCRRGPVAAFLLQHRLQEAHAAAGRLLEIFGRDRLWIELQHHSLPDDDWLVRELLRLAQDLDLPVVATHNAHYARQEGSRLRDALIAVRHNQSLTEARQAGRLPCNSGYHLVSPQTMVRRFAEAPQAVRNTVEITHRCQVSLDFSGHRLPVYTATGGKSEFAYLYQCCHEALPQRYPQLVPKVLKQLAHELDVIENAGLAGYFLIVWDIVRFARERGIRCQGRGSAAGSIVAYLLGISRVDPLAHDLLFERFLSQDRHTMPDIDLDFAADRREEVIQYVYDRYGAGHTAMVCNHVTYRARSAVRDLGKALGFPLPVVDRLAKELDTHSPAQAAEQLLPQAGEEVSANHPMLLLADLLRQIDGCPRHLSIHVGGLLITGLPLDQVVPLERATMPGRVVCQWDKDSVEDAGLVKIDLLSLRTLGLLAEAVEHVRSTGEEAPDLDSLSPDDPEIYRMLQRGDTVGAFQVESRAQQQMLPRLKPTCFQDLAVEIAILRPGPIQGGAVHPYLRRRAGEEEVTYLHPCLETTLRETLGVLLYQEQAIKVAVTAAGFSPGEADLLRRALSRNRPDEAMAAMKARFFRGAEANGINRDTAEAIFAQLAGFAGYGFCKSHSASFALIAYQTLYLKRYHPVAFYCALLNQQPMGFYSPEVIVGDARRHGVELLPPDVGCSQWRYTLERVEGRGWSLRMGLQVVAGIGEAAWRRIQEARLERAFVNLPDFCRRTRMPQTTVSDLIRAGAVDCFGERRQLLWQLGEIQGGDDELPLELPSIEAHLPDLPDLERTVWEYELLGISPTGQVMGHCRPALRRSGVFSIWEVKQQQAGRRVRVAGMAVVRQRPPTAKGMTFLSLEDESGLLDLVVRPDIYQKHRDVLRGEALLLAEGIVQRNGRAVSLLAGRIHKLRV